jgi:hypothetical protein
MGLYSITLSMICIVDDGEVPEDGYLQDIQVHIVEADDFDEAMKKAITRGRSQETDYQNSDGDTVYWKFKEVEYIRHLALDPTKVEIATRLEQFHSSELYRGDHDFHPENSQPIMDEESYVADESSETESSQ